MQSPLMTAPTTISLKRNRSALKNLLGFVITLATLAWVYFSVSWHEVMAELQQISLWALFPGILVLVIHFYIRALRWRFLLPGAEGITLTRLFNAIMIGNFANFILPLRAGEFVRPYLLSLTDKYKFARALSAVIIERFFDLCAVLVGFGILSLLKPEMPPLFVKAAWGFSVIAAAIFIFMVVGSFAPALVLRLAHIPLRILPVPLREKVLSFLNEFLTGTEVLHSPGRFILVVVLTAVVWISSIIFGWIALFFLASGNHSFVLAFAIGIIVALAVALPSSPGFIGVFEAGCLAAFALFGETPERATAYAILSHAVQYLFFIIYGVLYLVRSNLSFSKLRGAVAQVKT
jgi:glycosyltransferase 2 family protein